MADTGGGRPPRQSDPAFRRSIAEQALPAFKDATRGSKHVHGHGNGGLTRAQQQLWRAARCPGWRALHCTARRHARLQVALPSCGAPLTPSAPYPAHAHGFSVQVALFPAGVELAGSSGGDYGRRADIEAAGSTDGAVVGSAQQLPLALLLACQRSA